MKKYFFNILVLFFILNSCEVIEGPYNTLEGCTDINAFNYNENAGIDDSTCCYLSGCTDINALNYDSLACHDNDSCQYTIGNVAGCTDSLSVNYNPLAVIDNGSCEPYPKNVLIEYFTGHKCTNCPEAAAELKSIQSDIDYGAQVIGMTIHVSKSFARPNGENSEKFQYDFRTEWGDNWDASNSFNISNSGLPKGMVNRIDYPESHILDDEEWLETVGLELMKTVSFGIKIESSSNEITVNTRILNDISGSYNLAICLTESNIINWQAIQINEVNTDVEDYEHNYVLRSVLYDGSLSSANNFITGNKIEKNLNYNIDDLEQYNIEYSANEAFMGNGNAGGWNPNNMSVVAFIYDINTKEILQVQEEHLNH